MVVPPIAGWFIMENIMENPTKMDDDVTKCRGK